ncbi:MAG: DUF1934 domain-containing protein [Vulcanibacillus sp.]
MSREVKILVTTIIDYENEVKETMSNQYSGVLYFKGNDCFLRYKDNPKQELGNTWTIIKWNKYYTPYIVTLVRQGDIKMKQVFQEGYTYLSEYKGPFGNINLETITNDIAIIDNEDGGKIYLVYNMKISSQISGKYTLEVTYIG